MPGVAVVGTGHWGKNHARVYHELASEGVVDTLKICDLDESCARQWGEALGVEYATDYRSLLENDGVQAVSIVTPSKTHYRLAKEFMEAGRDVLLEKPMTMDVREAEDLIKVAGRTNRILMVGHIFRYHPAVRELKRMIDGGELGDIHNLIGNRLHYGVPRRDMGVIYALGIHELDLFCYLLGVHYPGSLTAVESRTYGQNTEETAHIFMDFGRVKGYAFESWLVTAYSKLRDLIAVGSRGSARIDYLKPRELVIFDTRLVTEGGLPVRVENSGTRTISLHYTEPLKEELEHFISCVVSRQQPLSDGSVGLRSVIMAEAAIQSVKTGTAVSLAEDSR